MMTVKDTANLWKVCEGTVRSYCRKGYVTGAVKIGGNWLIPDHYPQPYISRKKKFRRPSEKSNYVLFAIESGKALDFRILALSREEFEDYAQRLLAAGYVEKKKERYLLTQAGIDRCEQIRCAKRSQVQNTISAVITNGAVIFQTLAQHSGH